MILKIKQFISSMFYKHMIITGLSVAIFIILCGSIIFKFIEKKSFLDSVYFITTTVTTVGYGDISPQTNLGKIFSIIFGLLGIPSFLATMGFVIEKRLSSKIKKYIVHLNQSIQDSEKKIEEREKTIQKQEKKIIKYLSDVGTYNNNKPKKIYKTKTKTEI